MLTSFSYARLSNVSEHEIDDWHLWSVFGDIDRSRYNCSFDTIRDRVYFIPGYNVIRSSILLFTHDLTRLNYSRRERTISLHSWKYFIIETEERNHWTRILPSRFQLTEKHDHPLFFFIFHPQRSNRRYQSSPDIGTERFEKRNG